MGYTNATIETSESLVFIVAHRGGSPKHPENSAAAFLQAIRSGSDFIECDLQLTADRKIALHHDNEFYGTNIESFTLDELRALVPSLISFDEFLDLVEPSDIRLVLDLKHRDVDRPVADRLDSAAIDQRTLVTSTFGCGLRRIKRRHPTIRTGLSRGAIFTRISPRFRPLAARTAGRVMVLVAIAQIKLLNIDVAVLNDSLVDPWTQRLLRRHGVRTYCWTVDDLERSLELAQLGVHFLTTNDPENVIARLTATHEPGGSTP